MAFSAQHVGQALPVFRPGAFGAGDLFRNGPGLMRIVAGDAGQLSILVQRQDNPVLFLKDSHPQLILEVGLDEVRLVGGVSVTDVMTADTEFFQIPDKHHRLEIRMGFIRLLGVAIEAFLLDDSPGGIQLVVGIETLVLLLVVAAKAETGAIRVWPAAQGGKIGFCLAQRTSKEWQEMQVILPSESGNRSLAFNRMASGGMTSVGWRKSPGVL
jgi:hypothetical protein